MRIKRFAVMGMPISHSLSPLIHYMFAKQTGIKLRYDKFAVSPESFAQEVQSFFALGGIGLNITSPLKELAYDLSDMQTPRCQEVASANTLWHENGKLYADNTDGAGLVADLKNYLDLTGKSILILGAGGASRGIIPPLAAERPQSIAVLNRSMVRAEQLVADFPGKVQIADRHSGYQIIINATTTNGEMLTDKVLHAAEFCYDLRYAYYANTPFTQRAQQHGVAAQNGLGMLINQAALAFEIWHGVMPKI